MYGILLEYTNFLQHSNFLHNYFDSLTKLFSDLYLTKFLNNSAKQFFLYKMKMHDYNLILFCNIRTCAKLIRLKYIYDTPIFFKEINCDLNK